MNRSGFSLVEILVSVAILCILVAAAAPHYFLAVEQANVDQCGGTLESIWNAQRLYWLENRTFAGSLATLAALNLLDARIATATDPFSYRITSADSSTFIAEGTRISDGGWSGTITIDQMEILSGSVTDGEGNHVSP